MLALASAAIWLLQAGLHWYNNKAKLILMNELMIMFMFMFDHQHCACSCIFMSVWFVWSVLSVWSVCPSVCVFGGGCDCGWWLMVVPLDCVLGGGAGSGGCGSGGCGGRCLVVWIIGLCPYNGMPWFDFQQQHRGCSAVTNLINKP